MVIVSLLEEIKYFLDNFTLSIRYNVRVARTFYTFSIRYNVRVVMAFGFELEVFCSVKILGILLKSCGRDYTNNKLRIDCQTYGK